ncbi:MAG: hypothetical protein ACREE7_10875, partial [Dongiaceae bacterium]
GLACAAPVFAEDAEEVRPILSAQLRFGAEAPVVALNGVPLLTFGSTSHHQEQGDAAEPPLPRRRVDVGTIIAASALGVALVLGVAGEVFEDMFEDWDGPEVNIGNGDGSGSGGGGNNEPCSGVQVGDSCIGGG